MISYLQGVYVFVYGVDNIQCIYYCYCYKCSVREGKNNLPLSWGIDQSALLHSLYFLPLMVFLSFALSLLSVCPHT